jgi:hypothetical protein
MVGRWFVSLLFGLSALFVVAVPSVWIVVGLGAGNLGGLGAFLVAAVAGMVVAHKTAPTLKWLSAALVPTILFAIGLWFLWGLSRMSDLP